MKKERPILFSTPMVRAILEGKKVQTRRMTHDNSDSLIEYKYVTDNPTWPGIWKGKKSEPYTGWMAIFNNHPLGMPRTCPYGSAGDVLLVREEHYRYGQWRKNGLTAKGRQKWKFYPDTQFTEVRYYNNPPAVVEKNNHRAIGWYKRLARFMPKSACRIWLEITDTRVERLQDISEADAVAEGVEGNGDWNHTSVQAYEDLWNKINGPESWRSNPWVWVIIFKQIPHYQHTPNGTDY